MDIKLTAKNSLDAEGEAWLKKCEDLLNYQYEHISTEETMRRVMIYGMCPMKQDENGQYQYIDYEDMFK